MNTQSIIKRQLTLREYRGYIKGKILELQYGINKNMTPIQIEESLNTIQELEKILKSIE
ncbi:MAG: hypothetical protein KIS69_10180 [Bacteroidetes bacterium]|nr:hypothetical protein [Bacteroidota bacterium]